MRASTRAPFATVTSWWKIRPVTSAELSNVTLRANMRPVRRPQICTSLATTSPSKYPLEPRTRRSAQTRPKTLPWMCKSPSVSRKPSAVSASPRCDAGNSVFPGSRGVVLNARRGGAVIKKTCRFLCHPRSNNGRIRNVSQGDCGCRTGSRSEMELTASGGDVNAANSSAGPISSQVWPSRPIPGDARLTLPLAGCPVRLELFYQSLRGPTGFEQSRR